MKTVETPLYGYELAKSFLDRNDLSKPEFIDMYKLVQNCMVSADDADHPLKGYTGPEVITLLQTAGISIRSLVSRLKRDDGKCVSEKTIYRWVKPDGYRSMPASAFYGLCSAFSDLSKTPQAAWYALMCLCVCRFEDGEALVESRVKTKRQAIYDAARTLNGTALDSLYVTAMSYKQAFKEYGNENRKVWANNDAHKAAMRIDFERKHPENI